MELIVQKNDIAMMAVDAVVLPANRRLKEGSGASAAIFEAAGRRELREECRLRLEEAKALGKRLEPGVVTYTLGYGLPATFVIHAVVPRWAGGERGEYGALGRAYLGSLSLADELGCESIAFPLLAAGNNGFDVGAAAEIAVRAIKGYSPLRALSEAYLLAYDLRATRTMRDLGYEVEELVGQDHVLRQALEQQAMISGAAPVCQAANKFVGEAARRAASWLGDDENQEKLKVLGKALAKDVIAKRAAGFPRFRKALDSIE